MSKPRAADTIARLEAEVQRLRDVIEQMPCRCTLGNRCARCREVGPLFPVGVTVTGPAKKRSRA